jgi:hypothetical protein
MPLQHAMPLQNESRMYYRNSSGVYPAALQHSASTGGGDPVRAGRLNRPG